MADAKPRIELELTGIRFLFPHFITPVVPKIRNGRSEKQDPRFDGTVMVLKSSPHVGAIRSKFREALALEFGAHAVPDNFAGYQLPIEDGDRRADQKKQDVENKVQGAKESEFTRGYWLLKVKSGGDYPPALATVVNDQPTNLSTDELRKQHASKFYSGVNGGCTINFRAFRPFGNQKEPGISCYLNEAFSLNTGEKVASDGGRDPAAKMSGYAGKSSDVDPSARSASGF